MTAKPTGAELVPAEDQKSTTTLEIVRPERKSQNQPQARIIKREVALPDGSRVTAEVEVGFTQRGALTTEDQRTYYALIKQWEESGRSNQQTYFSLRGLAKHLKKKWGTNSIEALTQSLARLYATPFFWKNAYYDSARRETKEQIEGFRILDKLKVVRSKQDGHITTAQGYFQFNDFILTNLLANHTKPLLLDTVLGFRSEIAQILYTYIDLILADKSTYERRTKELFDDLGLRGEGYKDAAHRKQKLQKALKELQGVPLSTGCITSATLEKTKDEKDYKIVIRKGKRRAFIEAIPKSEEGRGEQAQQQITAPNLSQTNEEIATLTSQAEQLITYFYSRFPSANRNTASTKPLDQAISLITSHGYEKATYIIDFAQSDAEKTNFKIRTFGGVMQYDHRALEEYDRRQLLKEEVEKVRLEQEALMRQEEEARARARARLDSLSPDQYQQLYEKVKAEVFSRAPGWLTNAKPDGAILEGTIRAGMLAELERQDVQPPPKTQIT